MHLNILVALAITIAGFILSTPALFGQTIWECETVGPEEDYLLQQGITSYSPQLQSVTVRIFIHVIRQSNGSGGLTTQDVSDAIDVMEADFFPRQIYFIETGSDFIDNDNYYNFSVADFNSLIQENAHNTAIDIYLLPSNISYGRASGIPGIALVLGGSYAGTSVLSHEMGHCLGLWHTHSGRGCYEYANCAEAIDGSKCQACGDLVCDTPADPCLSNNVNAQCQFIGPPQFTPDVSNIMSYTPPGCMDHFTTGQFDRTFTMIENSPLLQNVIENTVLITIDQKLSNGSSVDSVARWDMNDFVKFTVPQNFTYTVGDTQVFQGAQKIISNEKYNNWNDPAYVTNHHVFVIDSLTSELTVNFESTHNGVTLQNNFLSAPGVNPANDSIDFKDPWLIDYPDPDYGNHLRNRGMEQTGPDALIFKERPSPFNPDYTTSFNGDVYQGAFLNQTPDPNDPNVPHYSVRAFEESIGGVEYFLLNWSGSNVTFENSQAVETAVVFTGANAVVTANMKGHLISGTTTATTYNNQRKIVWDDIFQKYHIVYEDGGHIFYTWSADDGAT